MRQYPEDEHDREELKELNAEPWMAEALKLNPEYVHWGPHEDYMWTKGDGWNSPVIKETWKDFGPWELDELNEIAHFYFEILRESAECTVCGGNGYHPDAQWVAESFYRHSSPFTVPTPQEQLVMQGMHERFGSPLPPDLHGRQAFPDETMFLKYKPEFRIFCEAMRERKGCWYDDITQEEVEALVKAGRLMDWTHTFTAGKGWAEKEGGAMAHMPSAAEVNAVQDQTGMRGHDGINRGILIRARCERFGIPVECAECKGHGSVFTAPKATLGLVLWWLHPRKGCSRGIEIKSIEQTEFPAALRLLSDAAKRNADRFAQVVKAHESAKR